MEPNTVIIITEKRKLNVVYFFILIIKKKYQLYKVNIFSVYPAFKMNFYTDNRDIIIGKLFFTFS